MGKKPLVGWTPYKTKAPSVQEVQGWWQWRPAANLGIPTGVLNGITVVDVDGCGHEPETLAKLQELLGPTPLVVATPGKGGGYQFYYSHSGERNGQGWELDGFRGDVRGEGGFVMAAGSLHPEAKQRYLMAGGIEWFLAQLLHLPPLGCELPSKAPQPGQKPSEGGRNLWLFGEARKQAPNAETKSDLEAKILVANASLPSPLDISEVLGVVKNVWGYKERGQLMASGEQFVKVTKLEWQRLNPDEVYLLAMLRLANALRPQFVIAQEQVARDVLRWGKLRLRRALKGLLASGVIKCVHKGGTTKGDAARYVWGTLLTPNITNQESA
jgi:hypothetical protein